MHYGITTTFNGTYDEALARVTAELQNEGFGIITSIDMQDTLRKKLGIETDRYSILGACNPTLAHKAVLAEPEIGLMLPCNVIVYEKESTTTVSAFNPLIMSGLATNPALENIATEVAARLGRVIERMGA